MKIETLIKILQRCNPNDDVMFFCDDEVSHVSHVEQSVTDKTVYLYEFEPNFTEQSEDRNIEIVVHSVNCFEERHKFIKTSHTVCQEQKHQQQMEETLNER
jgi:hypothetical protein